ncbi:MAG: cysteine desulfurase [Pseudomonadota bacterium]|nr:cysteine desulfurase [Pseudomonadota bacterium]
MLTNKTLNVEKVRQNFKFLESEKNIIYLDNASTTQKPEIVLDALNDFYRYSNANVHRGAYHLSEQATSRYEHARQVAANFIHAESSDEVVFVRGCTEAINLVASSYGETFESGDEVIISAMEHHANIVPWQMLASTKGIKIRVITLTEDGELDLNHFRSLLNKKTRFVSITHISNVLGTVNDVETMIKLAHDVGAKFLVDAAQSPAHIPIDVQAMDCDFLTFSAHKHYGPTGIGILYGKKELLNAMKPYQTGGSMITSVTFEGSEFMSTPHKFEAGTPAYVEAYGMSKALDYISALDLNAIKAEEEKLIQYTLDKFKQSEDLILYGPNQNRIGIFGFLVKGVHAHDVSTILDNDGIAIRAGHHCAMPLMQTLNVPALVRASLGIYNTESEIDQLFDGLKTVKKIFSNG